MSHQMLSVPVSDPSGAASDAKMRSLALALDPAEAQSQFNERLPPCGNGAPLLISPCQAVNQRVRQQMQSLR